MNTRKIFEKLGDRTKRMLPYVADGCTNKQIAEIMGLPEKCVENAIVYIYELLKLKGAINKRTYTAVLYSRMYPNDELLDTIPKQPTSQSA